MICYRDMTFCSSCCINTDCHRHFGKEEAEGARKWWSHDPDEAPVAFSDFSDSCRGFTPPKDMFKS